MRCCHARCVYSLGMSCLLRWALCAVAALPWCHGEVAPADLWWGCHFQSPLSGSRVAPPFTLEWPAALPSAPQYKAITPTCHSCLPPPFLLRPECPRLGAPSTPTTDLKPQRRGELQDLLQNHCRPLHSSPLPSLPRPLQPVLPFPLTRPALGAPGQSHIASRPSPASTPAGPLLLSPGTGGAAAAGRARAAARGA